jgi:hypothetical protein
MTSSSLQPHLAVPFGDMMLAGCFGLLMAAADLVPAVADPIQAALAGRGVKPPWEVGQL